MIDEPDISNIESVYVIYSADVIGDEQDIERLAPEHHVPAGYVDAAREERERVAAKFVETEGDDQYEYGYLAEDGLSVAYCPAGYVDKEGLKPAEGDEPAGEGRHRKWVAELTAEEWLIFAEAYLIDLDANGCPSDYEDTMGSITEYGHIPAVSVDNQEGWNPTNVLDSRMYVSIALKEANRT